MLNEKFYENCETCTKLYLSKEKFWKYVDKCSVCMLLLQHEQPIAQKTRDGWRIQKNYMEETE